MTGQDIIDLYQDLVDDDTRSTTVLLVQLNVAYDRVNTLRMWHYLEETDTSLTILANTVTYNLPSDFLYPRSFRLHETTDDIYSNEYTPVPYRKRRRFHKSPRRYFTSIKDATFTLTQTPESSIVGQTIEFDYQFQPAQLTIATSPVFNRAFHAIIAYEMARMYWYNEQDEKGRSWDKEHKTEYNLMFDQMTMWDAKLDAGLEPTNMPVDSWVDLEDHGHSSLGHHTHDHG